MDCIHSHNMFVAYFRNHKEWRQTPGLARPLETNSTESFLETNKYSTGDILEIFLRPLAYQFTFNELWPKKNEQEVLSLY